MARNSSSSSSSNPNTSNTSGKTLQILQWNANGILSKLPEFKNYLSNLQDQPDIICIQETHLNKNKQLKIASYITERRDRENSSHSGGVATLIKTGLTYTILEKIEDIEELTIRVKLNDQHLIISNIYNPPKKRIDEDKYITLASRNNVIVLGDFNAHLPIFGDNTVNSEGKSMEKIIETTDLVVLNDKSGTRINHNGNMSCIDIALASRNIALKINWNVQDDSLGSDHFPINISINKASDQEPNNNIEKYNLRRADWSSFKKESKEIFQRSMFDEDNSVYNKNIVEAIHEAAAKCIPKTSNKNRTKNTPYWSKKCNDAVNCRKRAQRKMRKTRDIEDCIQYRKSKAEAQKIIREEKKRCWKNYCNSLTTDTKLSSVWQMAKKMSGIDANSAIPTLKEQGNIYETAYDKATVLAETYTKTSSNENYSEEFRRHRKFSEESWAKNDQLTTDGPDENMTKINQEFAIHELVQAIRLCKNRSAPGQDDISYELLKNLPNNALQHLLQFYNKLWKDECIVLEWKESIILPFHKPGTNRTQPSSYRPISLTSALCKIMERLITTRLTYYLESNNILNRYQSAYRKNRCTLDHLIRLHDDINRNINNKSSTVAIFFDFSKAFDMLWREGLMHKLSKNGISGRIKNWIQDFLSNRTFRVKVNNTLSEQHELQNGTPQGSVISPVLFLLMINDFPTTEQNTETSLFADDSAIWRSGRNLVNIQNQLQKDIDKIGIWCNMWGFKLNEKKTIAMVFSRSYQNRQEKLKLSINGIEINTVTTAKFLGITFDQELHWTEHIQNIVNNCKARINLLRSLTGQDWGAGKYTLLRIYRTLIRPRLDYGLELFHTATKSNWKKLEVLQNVCLKIACGSMRGSAIDALQQECGELPLKLRRERSILRYTAKISTSYNNPASSTLNESWHLYYGKYKPGTEPVQMQVSKFLMQNKIPQMEEYHREPWKVPLKVDKGLSLEHKNDEKSTKILYQVLKYIENHDNKIHIYTDASVKDSGRAGSAFCIPKESIEVKFRLTNGTSTITAELEAIKAALTFISITELKNTKVLLLTDSLSAIKLLENGGQKMRSTESDILDEINYLYTVRNIETSILWIPSHINVPGNKKADLLAKNAAEKSEIDIFIPITLKETQEKIEVLITKEWQQKYENSTTAKNYKILEPKVSRDIKFMCQNRHKEVLITRLRLGMCGLHSYLHKIGKHQTGLCDTCQVPETVEHYLLQCPYANIFKDSSIKNLQEALNNEHNDTIYDKTRTLKRHL